MFYTVADICRLFMITRQTVYNWIRDGKLKSVRTAEKPGSKILFCKEEIDRMIREL